MGMDVFGRSPLSQTGEYFRNNVWWWRPLWDYCCTVAPHICLDVDGQNNSGDGLNNDQALELAAILSNEMLHGRTEEYRQSYYDQLAQLPRRECEYCQGTGIRTDAVGKAHGMPDQELSVEMQILTGRFYGSCNGCHGEGTVEPWESSYPFSVENVRIFMRFCAESGGFTIC